jgi:outer membrane protein OmpA-like peptidoglycan-associated protein
MKAPLRSLAVVAIVALAACSTSRSDYSTFILPQGEAAPMQAAGEPGCAVYFDVDSAQIRADQQPTIDRCAARFSEAEGKVALEGFADETGPDHHNLKLSQRRAQAVKDALAQRGVPADNLETRGYGEEKLAERISDDASLDDSRRVDMAQK